MAQLVSGWEIMLGIGIIVLIIGLVVLLGVKRKAAGSLLSLTGILWLLTFAFYYVLAATGLYAPGPYDPFAARGLWLRTVAIGVVIFIVGLGIGYYAVRSVRKIKGV